MTRAALQQLKNREGILKLSATGLFRKLHDQGLANQVDYVVARFDEKRNVRRPFTDKELKAIRELLREEVKEISALLKQ